MASHTSHIWIGRFGPAAPEDYFEQRPYDEDSDAPESLFAAEQGETSFDYDFVEISFVDDLAEVRSFVEGHSWWESYIDLVETLAAEMGVREINVFVLGDPREFSQPRSAFGADYALWYLGEFACE